MKKYSKLVAKRPAIRRNTGLAALAPADASIVALSPIIAKRRAPAANGRQEEARPSPHSPAETRDKQHQDEHAGALRIFAK